MSVKKWPRLKDILAAPRQKAVCTGCKTYVPRLRNDLSRLSLGASIISADMLSSRLAHPCYGEASNWDQANYPLQIAWNDPLDHH